MCGGDEAGRGALLGPLVIALVSIRKEREHKLPELGVRDSKLLTSKKREMLYDSIFGIAEEVKIEKIYPAEINSAMKNNISLNELEAIHFARLFDNMEKQVSMLYLDSPDIIEERFGIRIKILAKKQVRIAGIRAKATERSNTKIVTEHKADSRYPIVSAASIIAKVERDREIRKITKELGIDIGSGYPSDYKTIDAVRKNITRKDLGSHIRICWKTFANIKQTKLDNFGLNLNSI
ncbi:MAG: ribonuclease HII [Candidatus Micrarchaeaceae archaeon]